MQAKEKKILGKNGFVYKEKRGVIVLCDDESHQESVFNLLKTMGFKLRVVMV